MHDREAVPELDPAALEQDVEPSLFVLQTVYKGERRTVADGVAFPPPNEKVVINWRGEETMTCIGSLETLYKRFGQSPQVMWRHSSGILTEAEPQELIDSYS